MKERPIIFSSDMVRAILDGRKTQTRRVAKLHGTIDEIADFDFGYPDGGILPITQFGDEGRFYKDGTESKIIYCPYGQTGDRLWVKEKFRLFNAVEECSHYEECDCIKYHNTPMYFADSIDNESKWKPSIHMPRWASRINLEITDIRVERLQEINEEDAKHEGVKRINAGDFGMETWSSAFRNLWDSINSKRGYGWDTNPWVWVIEFKRI